MSDYTRDFNIFFEFFVSELRGRILSPFRNKSGVVLHIIPEEAFEEVMSNPNYLDDFLTAFTHLTYDYEKNYETFEAFGDPILNAAVAKSIFHQRPNLSPKEISNMKTYYQSNEYLSECLLTNVPTIDRMILVGKDQKITEKMRADVFEALVFAITKTIDTHFGGFGDDASFNFYHKMSAGHEFSDVHMQKDSKTLAYEIFGKQVSVKKDGQDVLESSITEFPLKKKGIFDPAKGLTITVNPRAFLSVIADLSDTPKDIIQSAIDAKSNSIVGIGDKRKTASNDAYAKLLAYIKKVYGIDTETFEENRDKKVINDHPEYGNIKMKTIKKKESLSFRKRASASKDMLSWDLVATAENGKRRLVATADSYQNPKEFYEVKRALLDLYLKTE